MPGPSPEQQKYRGQPITDPQRLAVRSRLAQGGTPPPAPVDPAVAAYLQAMEAAFNNSGGGGVQAQTMGYGSIFDASGQLQNMYNSRIGGINGAFDQAIGALDQSRGGATNEINVAAADFQRAFAQNQNRYRQEAATMDRQIRTDNQGVQRDMKSALTPIEADLRAQGADVAAQTALAQGVLATTQAQGQLQQDLSKRLQQIQGDTDKDRSNASAQVTQGGQTTLTNNYNDILGRIQAQRAQEIAQAEIAYQQAQMENARAVASQRAEIERYNASARQSAAAANQSQDPLERQMMLMKLQGMGLDLEAQRRAMNPQPTTRDINDKRLSTEARDYIMMSGGDPSAAYTIATTEAEKRQPADRDLWLDAIQQQLMYYFNPSYQYNPATRPAPGRPVGGYWDPSAR